MGYTRIQKDSYTLYHNENGCTIGTASDRIIEKDGFVFRAQNEKKRYNEYNDNAQFATAGAELRLLRRLRFHFRWEEEHVCCQRYCHVQAIGNL